MGARLFNSSDGPVESIEELSLVALTRTFTVPDDDRALPDGSIGTVVGVLERDVGLVVEFAEPFAALVDLASDDLVAVSEGKRADRAAGQLARRAP